MTAREPATVAHAAVPVDLRERIVVRDVIGGKETNPLWASNIGSADFARALEASLALAGLAAANAESARYELAATLQSVEQEYIGIGMTVSTTVVYDLIERWSNRSVWLRTVAQPYTATMGDAFVGAERLRLANEGSARANIEAFIDELLRTWSQTVP